MAYSKIGFHIAANCGGCGGIDNHHEALDAAGVPFTVYAANDGGIITQAARYRHATLIYRDVVASTVNPVDYNNSPAVMAATYWQRTLDRTPATIKAMRDRVWLELLNEPGREDAQAEWVGQLMTHMAALALRDGYRVMGPGWAPGNPEPHHWQLPGWQSYLRLCADHPGRVAVSLHEYSLDNDIHHGEPWHIGRFQFLFDACDKMGVRRPNVWITECGWTLNSMPGNEQAKADIDYLAWLYGGPPQIQAASLWTLQSGRGNGDLPQRLNALMPWLTEYTLTTDIPGDPPGEPPLPPVDPPAPPTGANMLRNPSFEDGWKDTTIFPGHEPAGWSVRYNYGDDYPNPYGQPYKNGEAVKKHRGMLPANEQNMFVWDGEWTYKIFGGGTKAFWFQMDQSLDLPAGTYRATIPVWVDHYHWNGGKDYNVDPNQAQVRLAIDGKEVDGFVSLPAGGKRTYSTDFWWHGGRANFEIHLRSNWDISGNFWLDGLSLEAVAVTPPPEPPAPPPVKHKAIVLKVPQDVALSEWLAAAAYAFRFRHTMTASHDDMVTLLQGGNADSYVKLAWAGRQEESGQLVDDLGYRWEHVPELDDGPLDGLRLGRPFAWRYVMTSAFDAGRSYGKHEGADYDIVGGAADNAADVLCLYDGTVDRSLDTTAGYGSYVRVKHERNGHLFYTRYAHLDRRYVDAGQRVEQGEALGEVGTTGNVTGEHVHINLEVPGYGLGGYVVADVVDPAPYIPSGAALPLYPVAAVDLLDYMRGDGRMYEVRHPNGATETFQTQVDGDWFYTVKNGQWEQLYADNNYIWRGADTSPGGGRAYVQFEPGQKRARWALRHMQVGQSWVGSGHQVQFYMKADCRPSAVNSGPAVNSVMLVARHASMTWNGITVPDVIELASGTERYWCGRGYGLVAWSSPWGESAIVQVYAAGERPPLVRERFTCF
jgi:murein DD-endopeptidase MepM/ murein hydrolase activator NlpD